MVACEELAGFAAEVREADVAELRLVPGEQVDAVFSHATFHWVRDHDALFAAARAAATTCTAPSNGLTRTSRAQSSLIQHGRQPPVQSDP